MEMLIVQADGAGESKIRNSATPKDQYGRPNEAKDKILKLASERSNIEEEFNRLEPGKEALVGASLLFNGSSVMVAGTRWLSSSCGGSIHCQPERNAAKQRGVVHGEHRRDGHEAAENARVAVVPVVLLQAAPRLGILAISSCAVGLYAIAVRLLCKIWIATDWLFPNLKAGCQSGPPLVLLSTIYCFSQLSHRWIFEIITSIWKSLIL
ncbi:hypothetical protein EJB05_03708, partial [Eragrostis curvula]